jgi:predicted Zn-dependent protease
MSGWMEFMDGNFEMAARIFGRAHSTSPLNTPLAAMYVQRLAATGRVAESLAVADAIAGNRPDDMWTWFAQAFASALRGDRSVYHEAAHAPAVGSVHLAHARRVGRERDR